MAAEPQYRQLAPLSLGGVAATIQPIVLPKKYRARQAGERSSFQGAGVLPVAKDPNNPGKVLLLLQQRASGKSQGFRWMDCGGKKERPDEPATECAARKFAKQVYGLFAVDPKAWSGKSGEKSDALLKEVLLRHEAQPSLLRKSMQDWISLQLFSQDPVRGFYHDQLEYHMFLVAVPYVDDQLLNTASELVDNGKRIFRWLPVEQLGNEPLAPRLQINALFAASDAVVNDEALFDPLLKEQNPPVRAPCTISYES
jgi:8-oxo-dGTP pyrophosphatase MutT (NUDIX family)